MIEGAAHDRKSERGGMTDYLKRFAAAADRLNARVGHWVAWATLALVLVQFLVVVLRFVFAVGFVPLQESVWYLHGTLFMLGAGYTLMRDEHVRVDVFYRDAPPRRKAWVDLAGALFLLLPVVVATFLLSFHYVLASWYNLNTGQWVLQGSTELSGLPLNFALKTVIWLFAGLLFVQGLAMAIKALLFLRGEVARYPVPLEALTR